MVRHRPERGQAWWDQILSRIRDADIFVFALSPESLDSVACDREWRYAGDLGKGILPVLVSDGVEIDRLPPALSWINVDYQPRGREVARLARVLEALQPQPLPDLLPEPPPVAVSYLSGLAQQLDSDATLSREEQSTLVWSLHRALRSPLG